MNAGITPAGAGAQGTLNWLSDRTDNSVAVRWSDIMMDAMRNDAPTPRTLKGWLTLHDGRKVETLQMTVCNCPELCGEPKRVWVPGERTVSAGASFAKLDDSRRDYSGIRTVWASTNAYVGYDADMSTVIIYSAERLAD